MAENAGPPSTFPCERASALGSGTASTREAQKRHREPIGFDGAVHVCTAALTMPDMRHSLTIVVGIGFTPGAESESLDPIKLDCTPPPSR
jgi:hypothetical protein